MGFFQNLRGPELLIILLIIVLLFGAKKLPETARGLGRSLRIFKAETKGLQEDEGKSADAPAGTAPQQLTRDTSNAPVPPPADPNSTAAPSPSSADERS